MATFLIVLAVIVCATYWFKVRADSIEDDSEGMVEPGSREPYGSLIWSMVSRKPD